MTCSPTGRAQLAADRPRRRVESGQKGEGMKGEGRKGRVIREQGQRQCPSLVASRNGMQIALSGSKSCEGDLMTHLAVHSDGSTSLQPSSLLPPPVQGLQRVFAVQFGNYLTGNLTGSRD